MRRQASERSRPRGMTLAELMIALAVVSALLPLGLAVLSQSVDLAKSSDEEFRGSLVARSVVAEMRRRLEEPAEAGEAGWSGASAQEEAVWWLAVDREAGPMQRIEASQWQEGLPLSQADFLVQVRLTSLEGEGEGLQRMQVELSCPVAAPLAARRGRVYTVLVGGER